MIPKVAVDAYVDRDLDDHIWVKDLSDAELWKAIGELKPLPLLNPKNMTHQLACFLLGVAFPQFAFWLDMGTGKTLITLELLRYWYECGRLHRAIVFVTSDKAFPTWEKQFRRFDIDLPYTLLEGSSINKWQQLTEFDKGLILVSYPGAAAMVTEPVVRKKGAKKGKKRWKLQPNLVERFWEGVDAVVMDESTRASNHGSLAFNLIDKSPATIRYALAGRPFGRDPTLLWAQHYLVDGGETLGPTLGMFREAFFTSKPNPWVTKARQKYLRQFKFDKRKETQLSKLIQHRSITYSADECIDLPKHIPIIEEVSFAQEAEAYYDKAIATMVAAKGNYEIVKNIFLRMRQLSSGFLGFKDDETGEKAQVEFDENPKFDRLMELLDEMPLDRKGVVFYEYTYSGRKIFEEAKQLGLKPIWLWSGTKDYRTDLRNFEERPDCRLAVVNNKVGAFSLDGLQVANYCFFYESPVSPIDREQAERRLRRQGQLRKVFQYDIIVLGSVDSKILDFHAEGEALMTALLRQPHMLVRGK
jgi:SNF2 family DNA or RNA helicase